MSQLKNKSTESSLKQPPQDHKARIAFLETENAKLRNIIALTPGYLFWKNRKGELLGCNNNEAQLFGLTSPDEIIGKKNSDLVDADLAVKIELADEAIYISGKEQSFEEYGIDIHRNPAIYLTKKIPLFNQEGEATELLGVSFDITERKKMENDLKIAKEEAEISNRAKSQFLAIINHELNTPLSSMIGLIEFLKQGGLPPDEEKNIIETIESCTQHLLSLVNDVLDFSRLEKEKYNSHMAPVYLPDIIDEVSKLLSLAAQKKEVALHIELDQRLDKAILADGRILLQILINLINNAIKFTHQGSVTIRVKMLDRSQDKIILEIAVIDTGKGIPSDKLELIFEPFQQLEDAYTRQSSRHGTGLGLTIVRKLIELMGGSIQVTSSPGQGSTFSFTNEFQLCEHAALLPTKEFLPSTPKIIDKKPLILLIEDDPIIQYIHKKMLEGLKCEVTVLSLGLDAIKVAAQHDLIFVDLSLPDISGFEVIKMIRKQNPGNHIPIVALTAYTGKEEKEVCLNAGANDFTSKPVNQAYLKKILVKYLILE